MLGREPFSALDNGKLHYVCSILGKEEFDVGKGEERRVKEMIGEESTGQES